ncbi:hypothetical protein EON65_43665 [archaeon]|nr:MAG: hypothetical protein EON65_43665 [archaeon]
MSLLQKPCRVLDELTERQESVHNLGAVNVFLKIQRLIEGNAHRIHRLDKIYANDSYTLITAQNPGNNAVLQW